MTREEAYQAKRNGAGFLAVSILKSGTVVLSWRLHRESIGSNARLVVPMSYRAVHALRHRLIDHPAYNGISRHDTSFLPREVFL